MTESKISKLIESTLSVRSPFFWIGMIWGISALGLSMKLGANPWVSAKWLVAVWALCLLDLVALAKAVLAAILLMGKGDLNPAPESIQGAVVVQAIFWGSIKFLCFGLFGILLWSAQQAPQASLLLGLATLIVVPLVGGFCWSQKELKYA